MSIQTIAAIAATPVSGTLSGALTAPATHASAPKAAPGTPAPSPAGGIPPISVYDGQVGAGHLVQRTGGPASADPIAKQAFETMTQVETYFQKTYGRNGWDNKGTALDVVVHQTNPDGSEMANAYWHPGTRDVHIGDGGPLGDGRTLKPLGGAPDVLAHEFTHAVVQGSGVRLAPNGQGGGLNESWADVLASGIDHNWQMGETIIDGKPIRDLSKPLYKNVKEIPPGQDEPHDLSAIPSYAAYQVAQAIGDDAMRQIWYTGLTGYLKSNSGYAGARRATEAAATQMYGAGSKQLQAVQDAWNAVGVTPGWNKVRSSSLGAAQAKFAASQLLAASINAPAAGAAPATVAAAPAA